MVGIPGHVIAMLTFPGVIVHELAHQLFCRLFRVAVFDVCYFRIGDPAGYVVHEKPATTAQNVWIGVGPFIVNTLVGACIGAPAAIHVDILSAAGPLDYFLLWLGISIAMHAFPSTGDAKSIRDALDEPGVSKFDKAFAYPIVGVIYLGSLASMFWLDAAYGACVVFAAPKIVISLLT